MSYSTIGETETMSSGRQNSIDVMMGGGSSDLPAHEDVLDSQPIGGLLGGNMVPIMAMITFLVFGGISFYFSCKRRNYPDPNSNAQGDIEAPADDGPPSMASKIFQMTTEERMELYSEAFDKNKHQTILKASAIVTNSTREDANSSTGSTGTIETQDDDDDDSVFAEDEDPSIYLALKDVRRIRRSTMLGGTRKSGLDLVVESGGSRDEASGENNNASNNSNESKDGKKQKRRRTSIIHPRNSMMSPSDLESGGLDATADTTGNAANNSNKDNNKDKADDDDDEIVRGNCVICFEDMQAGEMVVWSEHKSCPHVYHKDCMVAYLAHKKQSIKEIELDGNPCPTCRRKFVTVCTPCTTPAPAPRSSSTATTTNS